MKNNYWLVFATIFLIFFTPSVYAASIQFPGWDFVAQALSITTGMPTSMFDTLPEFLFHFLLPFLLIWFICLGFMKQLRIFTRAPNWIDWFISFSMAALTVYPTGAFLWIVTHVAGLAGAYATTIYFIMFFVGIFLYAVRWGAPQMGIHRFIVDLEKEEKAIRAELNDLRQKYSSPGNSMTDQQYLTKRTVLNKRLEKIQEKRRAMLKED